MIFKKTLSDIKFVIHMKEVYVQMIWLILLYTSHYRDHGPESLEYIQYSIRNAPLKICTPSIYVGTENQ